MDSTKAAEVMDFDTTGMVNEQLFLRIRQGEKIWLEEQAKIKEAERQRIEQLLTQVPEDNSGVNMKSGGNPGGKVGNPGGNVGNPGGNMGIPGGNVGNPGCNVGNPSGNVANPKGNITSGGNMATPIPLMTVQVPAPMPVPVMGVPPAAPKVALEMKYFWVQSALGPQLFMVPMIGGQPLGYPRMVNTSYPVPNLNPYLGSSYNIRANTGQSVGSSVKTSPDLSPELPRRTQNPKPLNPNANIFQPRQWQ